MFKAESGERLLEISAHDDEILCCAFSADGEFVATCSSDKKVKVREWEKDDSFFQTHNLNFCFANSAQIFKTKGHLNWLKYYVDNLILDKQKKPTCYIK